MSGQRQAWRVLLVLGFMLVLALPVMLLPAGVSAQELPRPAPDQVVGDAAADRLAGLPPDQRFEQVSCNPRPPVGVKTERAGEGSLSVTVTAGLGSLLLIRFGDAPNARLDLPGLPANATPPLSVKPTGPTYTFILRSTTSAPITLPLSIYDACGDAHVWNTFVGGGIGGFQVQASIADPAPIAEGNSGTKDLSFTVTLSSAASAPVSIQYATADGSATAPADYSATNGTLTFQPGETSKTIAVPVKGDIAQEGTETFEVRLSNPSNVTLGKAVATGTITDDDGAPSLSIADIQTPEGNSGTHDATFTVTLTPASGKIVTVQYATADDTAVSPSDYESASGSLTFNAGETTKQIAVHINGDTIDESDERFLVNLSNATNATIARGQAIGTIQDDEGAPTVSLSLSGSPFAENGGIATVTATLSGTTSQPVTVNLAFAGTATKVPGANADYTASATSITIPALNTTGSITLTGVSDTVSEGNESVDVSIQSVTNATAGTPAQVTATITEDDAIPTVSLSLSGSPFAENLGTATVTAALSGLSGQDVTVTLAFTGTAIREPGAGADYTASAAQITIPALQPSASITLTGVNDSVPEGDETVVVSIQSVSAGATAGAPSQVTATITDDDAPFVTLGISPSTFSEAGGTTTITATLSQAAILPATINLAFTGSAFDGTDYTHTGNQITIGVGQTSGTLVLTGAQDTVYDPGETVIVTIASATNAVDQAPPESVTATIADDDSQPSVTLSLTGSPLAENAGTATVTATLSNLSNEQVTVNLAFTGTATAPGTPNNDYTVTPAGTTIVIAPGQPSGSITLTGVNDSTSEGPETVIVDISSVTNGSEQGTQQVTATITDDDGPVVTTSAGSTAFTENGGPVTVDGGVTVLSPGVSIVSASVVISNALDGVSESLASTAAPVAGITPNYDVPSHTLSFAGIGTAADYQGLLQGVKYDNPSDNPSTTPRTITFQVTSVFLPSNIASKSISIGALNDAPTLSGIEGTSLPYAENDLPTQITATIAVADPDSPNLASATVKITNNCTPGEDVLALTPSPQNGITGAYTAATCTLVLSGGASPANYQTALHAVTYSNSSNNPSTLTRTVSVTVNDGTADSTTLTRDITVGSANDAPTVTPSGGTAPTFTEGDPALLVDGTITVTDPDTANLASAAITLTTNPDGGTEGLDVDLTGLVGLSKGGAGTATLTVTGTAPQATYQSALRRVTYSNSSQAPTAGSRTISFVASDGTATSTPATASVSVVAVNDGPTNTLPIAQTMNEDTTLTLSTGNSNAISIADLDAGSSAVQVALTAANGTLSLNGTAGLAFTAGDGTADATMTFTGTVTAINTALNGMTFTPTANASGSASIEIVTNDQGFTGVGGALSDDDTLNITINDLNDPPTFTIAAPTATVNEDSFGENNFPNWFTNISPGPANESSQTVTLSVDSFTNPSLFTAGPSLAPRGSNFDLVFTLAANANGTSTVTMKAVDSGPNGGGNVNFSTQTFDIVVNAVNDAPVITRPASISANEDQAFTFNGGNTISITDVDAASGLLTVTLGVTNGTLSLSGTAGLGFTIGDGTGDPAMTFAGTLTSINNALNGMTYTGGLNYGGPDTLTIVVNDNGNTGSGGAGNDSKSVSITVTAVDDAPINTIPGLQTFDQDTSLTFSTGNGNAISVADVDAGSGAVTVTLSTTAGTLAFGGTTNLSSVTDNAATITATGTIVDLNAGLQGSVFTPTTGTSGAKTISMTTDDNGNTGTGGPQSDTDTINLSITPLAAPPSLTHPASFVVNEDTAFILNGGNTVSVADPDVGGNPIKVSLDATHGKINLSGVVGLTFVDSTANNTSSVHFTGTVSAVNTAMSGMTYQGVANYNGADTLNIVVNDLGNNATGSPLSTSGAISITVNALNDKPTANAFASLPAQAGIPITYPAAKLGGSDVDIGSVLSVITTPDSVNNGTVTINGDGSFTFTPDPDQAGTNGTASFTYHVRDNGADNGNTLTALDSDPVTVSFNVAGPEIYFVKSTGSGSTCTLGTECTLTTALTNIGSRTNTRIFINDSSTYTNAVTLNSQGWLTSQGVTGVTFGTLFGINTPAQGTLATLPTLGQTRPSLSGAAATVTMHNSSAVRGVVINVSAGAGSGLVAASRTGTLLVTDTDVTSAGGNAIDISNTSVDFTGGGLTVVSTSGNGFEATGGGTITVQGTGNTINSGTGIALNVLSGTTIGAANLNFQSISSSGATSGIVLTSTGTSGGLVVTGDGTNDGSGGAVTASTGSGINATNVKTLNLSFMNVTNNGNAVNEDNLTALYSNAGTSAGVSLTHVKFTPAGATDRNVRIQTTGGSGTVNVNITSSTFDAPPGSNNLGHENVYLKAISGWTVNPTVSGSTFSGARLENLNLELSGTGQGTASITGSTFDSAAYLSSAGGNAQVGAGGISLGTVVIGDSPTLNYTIDSNNIRGYKNVGLAIRLANGTTGNGMYSGTVTSNNFGTAAGVGSGGAQGINVSLNGRGTSYIKVQGNTIRHYFDAGMYFIANWGVDANPGHVTAKYEIWGNTIANPDPNGIGAGVGGLTADIGLGGADPTTACFDIGLGGTTGSAKNSLLGSVTPNGLTNGGGDITLFQEATSIGHYDFPQYPVAADDGSAAPAYLQPRNDGNGTPTVTIVDTSTTGFAQVAAGACH